MTETDEPRLEVGQALGRSPIPLGVQGEEPLRLAQTGESSPDDHVGEHVAGDQHPIAVPPERDVTRGVPGCLHHAEATHLVPFPQPRATGCGGPVQCGPTAADSQWRGIRAMMRPSVSIASASASPHQRGSPRAWQTAWEDPWWSG